MSWWMTKKRLLWMKTAAVLLVAMALPVVLGGCSLLTGFDNYTFDGGTTNTKPTPPTGFALTSGGIVVTNADVQLTISVGAPQPMGDQSDSNSKISVGPISVQE